MPPKVFSTKGCREPKKVEKHCYRILKELALKDSFSLIHFRSSKMKALLKMSQRGVGKVPKSVTYH